MFVRLGILRAIHDVLDLRSACQRISSIESIILSIIYLRFFSRLESQFDTADSRLLTQSSLKTRLLLRESFDFLPSVAWCRTPIGISEAALHLPLIAVPFARLKAFASLLHVFKYQPRASTSNTSPLATVPLHFSIFQNPIAIPLPSYRSNQIHGRRGSPRQASGGGDPGGGYADEPASPMHEVRLTFLICDDEQF